MCGGMKFLPFQRAIFAIWVIVNSLPDLLDHTEQKFVTIQQEQPYECYWQECLLVGELIYNFSINRRCIHIICFFIFYNYPLSSVARSMKLKNLFCFSGVIQVRVQGFTCTHPCIYVALLDLSFIFSMLSIEVWTTHNQKV